MDVIEERYHTIRTKLFMETKWIGSAILKLGDPIILYPDDLLFKNVKTCAVSTKKFYINSKFVSELTDKEFAFVIIHELYHILFRHHFRQVDNNMLDHCIFNKAADYEVNYHILKILGNEIPSNLCKIPDSALLLYDGDDLRNLDNVTTEELYNELLNGNNENSENKDNSGLKDENSEDDSTELGNCNLSNENSEDGDGTESGNCNSEDQGDSEADGSSSDSENKGDSEADNSNSDSENQDDSEADGANINSSTLGDKNSGDIQSVNSNIDDFDFNDLFTGINDETDSVIEQMEYNMLSENLFQQYSYGTGEGGLRSISNEYKPKRIRWDKYLKRFLSEHVDLDDSSYQTPDRHYLPYDLILPGPCNVERFNNIGLFLDTSGSMTDKDIKYFLETSLALGTIYHCTVSLHLWNYNVYKSIYDIDPDKICSVWASIELQSGGTNYKSVADFICENCKKDVCYCIFTDGEFNYNFTVSDKIRKKTIFALSKNSKITNELDHLGRAVDFKGE